MHTEHLQNVRFGRVFIGWLVAIAVTSAVLLLLTALIGADESSAWSVLAAALGFLAGGFFAGFRAMKAPVLHGVAIALMSLVGWLVVNVLAFGVSGLQRWQSLSASLTLLIVLVMIVAAVVGALLGYNLAVVGKPGLSEHPD